MKQKYSLNNLARPQKEIIDIGAYDCAESLTFTSLFPNANVTAFECNPYLIDKCKVNKRINLIQKMVTDTPENNKFNICVYFLILLLNK